MKKIALLLAIVVLFWGCVTFNRNYELGTRSAINKDWDKAVRYYENAAIEDPDNSVYRLALYRAKLAASHMHLLKARALSSQKMINEALAEYEKALAYDPYNRNIMIEMQTLTGEEEPEEKKPEIHKIEPPVKLKISVDKIDKLKFIQDASLRTIFQTIGRYAGINVLFDEQFRDVPFSIELLDMTFEEAVQALCLASKNFFRIINEKTIIVVPDQPMKRTQYELQGVKIFYLSNINAQEIQGILPQIIRKGMRAPTITIDKNLNSITVRDAPEVLELAERIINLWDKPKGEVVIDLELMEVSRVKLKEMGIELSPYLIGFQYGKAADEGSAGTLYRPKEIDLGNLDNYQVALPSGALRFLATDSDTKVIAQPRLRGVAGEDIEYMVGDQVPVPQTQFAPIAAGGLGTQPLTTYEYKDIGIKVKIKPRIHKEDEITLELDMELKALAGTGYADIPIITTRNVKNVIRLKNGETNLLAGLLKDEERKSIRGIPGLSSIPLLGGLFSRSDETIQQTDVIMTITPYIIRNIPVTEAEKDPVWVNLNQVSTSSQRGRREPEDDMYDERIRRERLMMDRIEKVEKLNRLSLSPTDFEVPRNREFRINLVINSSQEIGNMSISVSYDPQVVEMKDVVVGSVIQQLGENPSFLKNIDNSSGTCTIGFTSPRMDKGFQGRGRLAVLVFTAKAEGETQIGFAGITVFSTRGQTISFETIDSRVVVR